jgi:hypothetical protein
VGADAQRGAHTRRAATTGRLDALVRDREIGFLARRPRCDEFEGYVRARVDDQLLARLIRNCQLREVRRGTERGSTSRALFG